MRSKLFQSFRLMKILNTEGKERQHLFTQIKEHTLMHFFPKSTYKLICKMQDAGISFLFLNVDVIQKESCCIILNSISSESKQACPKSKDTLRFTCFDTRNI